MAVLKSRKVRDERMSNSSEIRGFHVGYRDSVATGVDTRPALRVVLKRVDTAKVLVRSGGRLDALEGEQ